MLQLKFAVTSRGIFKLTWCVDITQVYKVFYPVLLNTFLIIISVLIQWKLHNEIQGVPSGLTITSSTLYCRHYYRSAFFIPRSNT